MRLRRRLVAAEDLDRVAILEDRAEWSLLPVNARANGGIAYLCMDRVGEIERGCAGRQPDELALR